MKLARLFVSVSFAVGALAGCAGAPSGLGVIDKTAPRQTRSSTLSYEITKTNGRH